MTQFSLVPLSVPQLELLAAAQEPEELLERADPGAFPPSFVASRSLELASELGCVAWAGTFLIVREADKRIVGSCGFKTAPAEGRVEVGYGVSPAARGQGAATVALGLLADLAFASGAESVLAEVLPGNRASLRVVEKAGFRQVGTRIDNDSESVQQWILDAG